MDDRRRIEALVGDGRITREEADRLLSVLDDIDGTERELDGLDAEVRRQDPGSEQHGVDEGVSAQRGYDNGACGPDHRDQDRSFASSPEGMAWVDVKLLAGDLEIEVDDELRTPTVAGQGKGETALEQTARGYRLGGAVGADASTFLGRLIGGFTRGNVRLSVPRGWGVRLEMKAGDVTVRGPLAFLSGHLLAGDLDADELLGIDLEVKAGDIDLALRISEGRHRIHAVVGDLNVRLYQDSNVAIRGRVSIGDLTVPSEWSSGGRGLGTRFEGTLGQGIGGLDLALGTGDLEIVVADE